MKVPDHAPSKSSHLIPYMTCLGSSSSVRSVCPFLLQCMVWHIGRLSRQRQWLNTLVESFSTRFLSSHAGWQSQMVQLHPPWHEFLAGLVRLNWACWRQFITFLGNASRVLLVWAQYCRLWFCFQGTSWETPSLTLVLIRQGLRITSSSDGSWSIQECMYRHTCQQASEAHPPGTLSWDHKGNNRQECRLEHFKPT